MVFSKVIVVFTISCRLFVFGRSRAKISAGFTDVSGLAIAAFDRVYCSLSVLQFVFVFVFDSSKVVELVVKWL